MNEWLKSDKAFHMMRDHPLHDVGMLGSAWGVKLTSEVIMKYQSEYFHNNYKTCFQWDTDANLRSRGGPVWDHVFVCEKGHFIPFEDLHPAIKVKNFLDAMF